MLIRLNTVRAKLTTLVALSAIASVLAVLILSWIMHRQLIDEVDDRVPEATRGFELEIEDDQRDLSAAVGALAAQESIATALRERDAGAAHAAAEIFYKVYPDIDIALFSADGALLAQVGVAHPPASIAKVPELAALGNDEVRTIARHGCEAEEAPAALLVARRLPGSGVVAGCIPLDAAFVKNASDKLGLELVVLDPANKTITSTPHFPMEFLSQAALEPSLASDGAEWALARIEPKLLESAGGRYAVALALDVTDIRTIVRDNMLIAAACLALAGIFSLIFGSRLARIMSSALSRVNTALRKLEQQEYVHAEVTKTGDELEDLAVGFNHMVEGLKERDKLRTTFGKYMTQTVMDHLLAGKVQLGGESIEVTILFSDIRSFTSISENMDAQQLVALLNEYFTEMVTIIMEEDGVVDKYIGDAIMAVFGAPVNKDNDPQRAVRAAVRMRAALASLNERLRARGVPELKTGIGIHTGEVVAGNIGSESRMEYTVIGDAVNLASRLETSTKDLGAPVLMSDETYELTKHMCRARPIREITVKGRAKPVLAYEVVGLVEDSSTEAAN